MDASFNITGLKELQTAMQDLPARIERNIMAGAIAAGTRIILNEAKVRAPDQDIKKALSQRQKKGRKGEIIREVYIKQKKGMNLFYAKFFEFGTASYYTGKGRSKGAPYKIPKRPGVLKIGENFVTGQVTHPGIKPQPFMRPALDTKASEAIRTMQAYIKIRLPMETGAAAKGKITQRMLQESASES
jgi:HK97 gp10 family phage protein